MRRSAMGLAVLGLFLGCSVAMAAAEGVALTIRTDRPEAVYARGESVTFIIEMKAGDQPVAQAAVNVELSADAFAHSEKRQVAIESGRAEVRASRPDPSMLWIRATYTPEGAKEVKAIAGAAFSYEDIQPSMPPPDDFDEFWAAQKALVDAVPMNPVLTPMPSPSEDCEVFAVTLDNLDGTKVTGYLAKPTGPGPFPGLVRFYWSGVYSLDPQRAVYDAQLGYMAFHMNPHDVENGKPKEYYEELGKGRLADYARKGRESRETSYLRLMFLRCYRAAEFVASRPDWNGRALVTIGDSMGGGQALAAAALNSHVTAVAVLVPAMCDHTAPLAGRTAGWPWLVPFGANGPDQKILTASRYVDGVNFASRITVPAVVETGFQDTTCPSTTVFAVYNALQGPKQMAIDPLSGHGGEKPNWTRLSQELLRTQASR